MQRKIIRRAKKKKKKKEIDQRTRKTTVEATPQMIHILELAHKELKLTD